MSATPWLLIDGYNLLHASGVFGNVGRTSLEASREALLDWLGQRLSQRQRERTTIVFDAREAPPGLPAAAQKHSLDIRFAPRGCEADDLIEDLIEEHEAPRQLVVVSSDHRLHRAARRRKALAIDSQQWVAELQQAALPESEPPMEDDRQGGLSAEERQKWLDEFGLS